MHELNASDIIGKSITIECAVDWITGDIVYNIKVSTGTCYSVLYTFTGNAAVNLPLSATDYTGKIESGIQTALGVATVAAGVAMAAPTSGASTALIPAGGAITAGATAASATNMAMLGGATMAAKGGADYLKNARGKTSTIGSIGGTAGVLSPMQCYFIVTRPKKVEADDYGKINGYPCMKSYKIGDLEGYILVDSCNWAIPGATAEELNEIEYLMSSEGAIL